MDVMSKIIFSNVNYIGNAGDFWSSPLHYYDFSSFDYEHIHFLNFAENKVRDKIFVIGGGGLIITKTNYLTQILESILENNKVIFWGIGSNTTCQPFFEIFEHKNVLKVGVRDITQELQFDYLPCVSCKNILFDKKRYEEGGIGLIEHPDYPIEISNLPKISNNSKIENILDFIGSKSIIISSTFHGIYWSQLMNKKVLYYNETGELNSKFLNMKHRVSTCNKNNYLSRVYDVSSTVNLLSESRNLNNSFYKDVISLLK